MCIFAKFANIRRNITGTSIVGTYSSFANGLHGYLFGKMDMINIISLHFGMAALLILAIGSRISGHQGLITVIGDSYSAWLGILVDALLLYFINWAIRREERDKLINQFASESNDFALDATKRLRKKGWLTNGRLNGIDMTSANLDEANLSKAKLQNVNLSYASLNASILVEADFSNSNLTGSDLSNTHCRWTNFQNANLRWANLENATLDGANFEGADLRFARIGKFNKSTVSFEGALMSENLAPEEIELVQNSVKLIRNSTEEFSMAFYRELFKANPIVKTLFISEIKNQAVKFAQLFELLVSSLDSIDKLLPALKSLGKRHANYGVEEYHYEIVGVALVNTLKKSLGRNFTPQVESAWLKTYGLVSLVMVDSAKGLL